MFTVFNMAHSIPRTQQYRCDGITLNIYPLYNGKFRCRLWSCIWVTQESYWRLRQSGRHITNDAHVCTLREQLCPLPPKKVPKYCKYYLNHFSTLPISPSFPPIVTIDFVPNIVDNAITVISFINYTHYLSDRAHFV